MDDPNFFSKKTLHAYSYRYLQAIAKSMHLPCHFKKLYLIELIWSKKFRSETEVNSLIQRMKMERKQLAELRQAEKMEKIKDNAAYVVYKYPPSSPKKPKCRILRENYMRAPPSTEGQIISSGIRPFVSISKIAKYGYAQRLVSLRGRDGNISIIPALVPKVSENVLIRPEEKNVHKMEINSFQKINKHLPFTEKLTAFRPLIIATPKVEPASAAILKKAKAAEGIVSGTSRVTALRIQATNPRGGDCKLSSPIWTCTLTAPNLKRCNFHLAKTANIK